MALPTRGRVLDPDQVTVGRIGVLLHQAGSGEAPDQGLLIRREGGGRTAFRLLAVLQKGWPLRPRRPEPEAPARGGVPLRHGAVALIHGKTSAVGGEADPLNP